MRSWCVQNCWLCKINYTQKCKKYFKLDKLNAQDLTLKTYKFYRIQKKSWCVNSYLLNFLSWQKICITNLAIPLGAEDSLLAQIELNKKNKSIIFTFRDYLMCIKWKWNEAKRDINMATENGKSFLKNNSLFLEFG